MATITEDYVSFETAKLLKDKGFGIKEETRGYYPIKGDATGRLMFGAEYHHNTSQVQIAASTLQMAMKWLREVHNLYIQLEITIWPRKGYFVKIYLYKSRHNNFEEAPFVEHKDSYEQACEVAIKYCLEYLI